MSQNFENESNDPRDFEIRDRQILAVKRIMDRIFEKEKKKERRRRARLKNGKSATGK